MGIICEACGRDIDALGQDNMGVDAPLCEDCWGEQQSHAVAALKRENASLRRRNESLDKSRKALGLQLAEANRKLREDGARPETTKFAAGAVKDAAMPCLKDDGAHSFAMPDVSVEINAEKVAETVAKSLRESVQPALRMAVE